jgi:hypothetical protein
LNTFLGLDRTFISFYGRNLLLDNRLRHMHINEHSHQIVEKLSVQLSVLHLVD